MDVASRIAPHVSAGSLRLTTLFLPRYSLFIASRARLSRPCTMTATTAPAVVLSAAVPLVNELSVETSEVNIMQHEPPSSNAAAAVKAPEPCKNFQASRGRDIGLDFRHRRWRDATQSDCEGLHSHSSVASSAADSELNIRVMTWNVLADQYVSVGVLPT
jgi:hypothetical protein